MFSASAVAGDQNSPGRKKGSEAHNFAENNWNLIPPING
jgi:hypothetical protein